MIDQVKDGEKGTVFSTHGKEKECIYDFGGKFSMKETTTKT
jgi:hypothetical protein